VGSTPGVTKGLQEIHLDKHIRLLDSPGIVFSSGEGAAAAALRNAVKVCASTACSVLAACSDALASPLSAKESVSFSHITRVALVLLLLLLCCLV
jgi:GTP-binding protein EngB required for normal cell division